MADETAGSLAVPPPPDAPTAPVEARPDLDPRSAVTVAVAVATVAIAVWFIRSVPRTLAALAVGTLIALALNPLVEALQRRFSIQRRIAVSAVLSTFTILFVLALTLVAVPTIRQFQDLDRDIPRVVNDLEELPLIGPRLQEENASREVEEWLNDLPDRLSVDATPVERVVGRVADGIAAGFLTLLLAVTLLLDGAFLVDNVRRLVPEPGRERADRFGRLVYQVIGKYIAGSLLVAAAAGTTMLTASLVLGVPLAPLIGGWVMITNMIPQIGGFLGAVPFVLLGTTQSTGTGLACLAFFLVYQNIENHVIQPLVVGRAVKLSPPATMVAALVGVSAGGVVGALFAVPILGASKAIYLAVREERARDT